MWLRSPVTQISYPGRNVYLTSCFILSVLSLTGSKTSVVLHVSGIPRHIELLPDRIIYLTSWFILSVLFLAGVRCLWFLHVAEIPHHTDLQPW